VTGEIQMEKKYYQIVAKTPEDWKVVHELLMQDGSLEDNIPHYSIECINDIKHSETRSTYLMTDEEAELLRQSDRILNVALDPSYHPESRPKAEPLIKKHGRSVRNYRSLKKWNPLINRFQTNIPTSLSNSTLSSEHYRTGYQILRCTSENNPFPSDSGTVLYQDIEYNQDGTDVDCIVVDNGMFFGHPEFCSNEYDPPNYIRGNVLSRHGICGILDLALDAPYYLDPDWFNADPTNRLEKRWDGTTVPKEVWSINWWSSKAFRSPSFPDFGSIYIPSTYTREDQCGKDQKTSPNNLPKGDHGTPCGSLLYGKNYGWAFNSNKWSIGQALAGLAGPNSSGLTDLTVFDITKIFHKYKPINPKFGTKNPTVSSNSWGLSGNFLESGFYSYRNGTPTQYDSSTKPNFLNNIYGKHEVYFNTRDATIVAGNELIDSGVIFVAGAGNSGRYLGTPSDEDYNNYIVASLQYSPLARIYVNRPGYPVQIGHTDGSLSRYKTFIIGAIDDEYTGRYDDPPSTVYGSEPAGKETLARYREFGYGDYSAKGSGVDFYAPADGTLAASSDVTGNNPASPYGEYPNPYQPFSDIKYYDREFGGTSSACPVAAGLIACFVQNNRDMSLEDLKNYLRNNITNQNSSQFFIGPRPGNDPNDSAWIVPYSVMGRAVKIIKEVTSRSSTPNPTFTPTYGINSSSGANERFIVTQNSFKTHKIEILGIKNFDETPATYELNVKTGYYKVGSRFTAYLSSGASVFNDLSLIKLRVDPSNSKKLQLTDSDGQYGWDDMEITVTNGEFIKVSTEIYYVFRGGTLATSTAYTPSSVSAPSYTPPSPGAPGSIVSTGGNLIVTGNITADGDIIGLVSDERLKTNIKPIDNALDKIENLEGFTYNFNEVGEKLGFDPNERHSGVSAQDVKNVLPEASAPAPRDNNYLTVKYDKLIPLLIEGIKDLKNDIDDLKNKDDDNK